MYDMLKANQKEFLEGSERKLILKFWTKEMGQMIFKQKSVPETIALLKKFLINLDDDCVIAFECKMHDEPMLKVRLNSDKNFQIQILDQKFSAFQKLLESLQDLKRS